MIATLDIGPVASWLAEVYLLATAVLVVAGLAMIRLGQPARRLAVARAAFVALASIGPLVAAGRWIKGVRGGEVITQVDAASPESFKDCAPPPVDACGLTEVVHAIEPPDPGPAVMVALFAGGSGLAGAWLALGAVAAARLRRRSRPAPDRLRAILARVAGQGGRTPRLLVGPGVAQPVALGLIRPAILLPIAFAEEEPDPRIESAISHELAHVRNGDLRLLALSRLLLPLLFAHPLFAWLRRRVRADQEALADLEASRREGRIAYAEALLGWARSGGTRAFDRAAPALGLWDRPSGLRRRIALLLDRDLAMESACPRRWRLGVVAATAACIVGLGAVALGGPVVGPFGTHTHDCSRCERRAVPAPAALLCPTDVPSPAVFCCPKVPAPGA